MSEIYKGTRMVYCGNDGYSMRPHSYEDDMCDPERVKRIYHLVEKADGYPGEMIQVQSEGGGMVIQAMLWDGAGGYDRGYREDMEQTSAPEPRPKEAPIKCKNCNNEMSPEYKFCEACGEPLKNEEEKKIEDLKAKLGDLMSQSWLGVAEPEKPRMIVKYPSHYSRDAIEMLAEKLRENGEKNFLIIPEDISIERENTMGIPILQTTDRANADPEPGNLANFLRENIKQCQPKPGLSEAVFEGSPFSHWRKKIKAWWKTRGDKKKKDDDLTAVGSSAFDSAIKVAELLKSPYPSSSEYAMIKDNFGFVYDPIDAMASARDLWKPKETIGLRCVKKPKRVKKPSLWAKIKAWWKARGKKKENKKKKINKISQSLKDLFIDEPMGIRLKKGLHDNTRTSRVDSGAVAYFQRWVKKNMSKSKKEKIAFCNKCMPVGTGYNGTRATLIREIRAGLWDNNTFSEPKGKIRMGLG